MFQFEVVKTPDHNTTQLSEGQLWLDEDGDLLLVVNAKTSAHPDYYLVCFPREGDGCFFLHEKQVSAWYAKENWKLLKAGTQIILTVV